MWRRTLRAKWTVLTHIYIQHKSCSHEYFQQQHSSRQTAHQDSHGLGSCAHSWCFAVVAVAAATAAAASAAATVTRDRLHWQAERSRFCPNDIIQEKFKLIIFSWRRGKGKHHSGWLSWLLSNQPELVFIDLNTMSIYQRSVFVKWVKLNAFKYKQWWRGLQITKFQSSHNQEQGNQVDFISAATLPAC